MMKAILNKFKSMPESVKATLVFAIASFATSGINYLTTPIFTRLLTGAVRTAVHQALKKIKYVKKFRLGQYGEGEDGVTIVEFK